MHDACLMKGSKVNSVVLLKPLWLLLLVLLFLADSVVYASETEVDETATNDIKTRRRWRQEAATEDDIKVRRRWRRESVAQTDIKTRRRWRREAQSSSDDGNDDPSSSTSTTETKQKYCDAHEGLARREARRRRWLRRLSMHDGVEEATTKTAYHMVVLATLAYLPFHKRGPLEAEGFRLERTRSRKIVLSIVFESQYQLCRLRQSLRRYAIQREKLLDRRYRSDDANNITAVVDCKRTIKRQRKKKKEVARQRDYYAFQYFLFDWYESTSVLGVKYHDTDLIVSTQGEAVLAIAFAGTASAADHVTNVQTFEPAAHSGIFHAGSDAVIEGSLHRGFLNAYSRVHRGYVLRLCENCTSSLTKGLNARYGHCTLDAVPPVIGKRKKVKMAKDSSNETRTSTNATDVQPNKSLPVGPNDQNITHDETLVEEGNGQVTIYKKGGCRSYDEHLMTILREIVTSALVSGKTVHVSGHSLGGGLATLLALDIIINFPQVPVSKLHLWTFGAPQVSDDAFLKSAMDVAPRLRPFVKKNGNEQFHRFVTLSDECKADFVASYAEYALPSSRQTLGARTARKLGGIRGSVAHFADPHYLLTPEQYKLNATITTNSSTDGPPMTVTTTTKSSIAAHSTINYLLGISRESQQHPLSTDLPAPLREWIGEGITTSTVPTNSFTTE